MFVKPHQWPTPSESIAIYCVRKLVSCVTNLQSCAKKTHIFSPAQKKKIFSPSHLKKLTSIKKLWETRNDLRIVAWKILLSLLYRNWSVNLFNQITRLSVNLFNNWSVNLFNHFTRLVGVPDFLRCTLWSVANYVIAWDKKPRQKRWVCFVSQK